jgi:hypothetical protein
MSIAPKPQRCQEQRQTFFNGKRDERARKMQIPVEPLPDLRDWWRSMKPYEGKYAKPRPADLVVP